MPALLRFTFWTALLATLASAAAYTATLFGHSSHLTLLLLPLLFVVWPTAIWQWRRIPRRNLVSEVFGDIPLWLKAAAVALMVFAFANYFVCRSLNEGGRPERLADGRTVLMAHDEVVREIGPVEFTRAQVVQMRMLTGFFVTCFGAAVLLAEVCWIKNGTAMAGRRL